MFLVEVQNKSIDPVRISQLGADAVMLRVDFVTNLI